MNEDINYTLIYLKEIFDKTIESIIIKIDDISVLSLFLDSNIDRFLLLELIEEFKINIKNDLIKTINNNLNDPLLKNYLSKLNNLKIESNLIKKLDNLKNNLDFNKDEKSIKFFENLLKKIEAINLNYKTNLI